MLSEPLDDPGDRGLCGEVVPVVGNSILGFSAFVLQWGLGGFPAGELGVVPAPRGLEAGEAYGAGGIDEEDGVAFGVEPGLVEEGGVKDDEPDPLGGRTGDCFAAGLVEDGVEEFFESFSLGGVAEDDGGDGGAVDGVVWGEDLGPPPLREGVADVGLGEEIADVCVGVDDEGVVGGEEAGDGGLAGADAAGEAEDEGAVCRGGVRVHGEVKCTRMLRGEGAGDARAVGGV